MRNRPSSPRTTHRYLLHRRLAFTSGAVIAAAVSLPLALSTSPAVAARRQSTAQQTTIVVEKNATWGDILALSGDWAVYRLTSDGTDKSTCTGACAKTWPPVMLAKGQKTPESKGVSHLGSFARPGGGRQVTYEGIPLYRFVDDKKPGQVTGNVKDRFGQWWTVDPAKPKAVPVKKGGGSSSGSGTTTTTTPGGGVSY